jgi:brefeldin A-inhibited guanine nucleotide-exchange protein
MCRFLLQKIIEIAYYNIDRIRFEWSQIWSLLQPHFNTVACHPSTPVATFAVDSLRQLSMKFLERDELAHYNTQQEFLKSFEWIMRHTSHAGIRELILGSLVQMIKSRAKSIKSGWKSIFVALSKAAAPPSHMSGDLNGGLSMTVKEWEKLVEFSFSTLDDIWKENADVILNAGALVDYISALTEFAILEGYGTVHDDVGRSALRKLGECGRWLIKEAVSFDPLVVDDPTSPSAEVLMNPYIQEGIISEDHFFLKWFPLLSAMGRVVSENADVGMQTLATEILFDTLQNSAVYFDGGYWTKIHRSVILPLFEEDGRPIALQLFIDLLGRLLGHVGVVRDGLALVGGMISRRDEKLSMVGQVCLQQFLQKNIGGFEGDEVWEAITCAVERACRDTIPSELLNCRVDGSLLDRALNDDPDSNLARAIVNGRDAARREGVDVVTDLSKLDFEGIVVKCGSHLELMEGMSTCTNH